MIRKLYPKVRASRWVKAAMQILENPDLVPGRNPDHEGYANFLFLASFGDKWCIASFLPNLLERQANVRILAEENDRELLRIFLGREVVTARVKFVSSARLRQLYNLFSPHSVDTQPLKIVGRQLDQTYAVLKNGFPSNRIRPLHLVQYPYFSDLMLHHGVSYGTLLRMMLYLPPEAVACAPKDYTREDHNQVQSLFCPQVKGVVTRPVVLVNVVNFSHEPLSLLQIGVLADYFVGQGFEVYLNTTLHPRPELFCDLAKLHQGVYPIEIPGHLLALASELAHAVIGVIGGAINVALQFSTAHILSFYTPGKFLSLESEVSIRKNSGNVTVLEQYNEDWLCVIPDRVVRETYVGNPEALPECELRKIAKDFAEAIASTICHRKGLDTGNGGSRHVNNCAQ